MKICTETSVILEYREVLADEKELRYYSGYRAKSLHGP